MNTFITARDRDSGLILKLEIDTDAAAAIGEILTQDLNQKQAAAFCGVHVKTFLKWNVPTNQNGRYSVAILKERKK